MGFFSALGDFFQSFIQSMDKVVDRDIQRMDRAEHALERAHDQGRISDDAYAKNLGQIEKRRQVDEDWLNSH